MNDPRSQMRRRLQQDRSGSRLTFIRLVPGAIIVASLAAGALVFLDHERAAAQLKERVHQENRLRMRSTLEHVENYFDAVYSTLLFVSLDNAVQAMRKDSRDFIQRLYDHEWEHHRLSELYVVERNFAGLERPFQTFERGAEAPASRPIHTLARELEEYETQRGQIRQFLADSNLQALISPEIHLCVNDPEGERARGVVYSLPIHGPNGLAGIVAGMLPTYIIERVLNRGQYRHVDLLANSRRDLYGGQDAHEPIRAWFKDRFSREAPPRFFAQRPESFPVGDWIALWTPVNLVSADRWWLVHLYPRDAYLQGSLFAGTLGHAGLAGTLVLAGIALALLARANAKRLEDQLRHLREREQLERQVQAASEREQRRIGEDLHEDLCQRLTGLEAAGKSLEALLAAKSLPESALAEEISAELHQALVCARQLADELQPVSLLEEGFYAALDKLALHTEQRAGIPCRLEGAEVPAIKDPAVATHLYRIAQEALANAVRHAHARHITIRLSVEDQHIALAIADDGAGLPENATQTPGLGLRVMRYRSALIGGDLELRRAPDGGTVVICRCPIPPEPSSTPAAKTGD